MRRCKDWAHQISWKYLNIGRPVLSVFASVPSTSFLFSILNSFQNVLKISDYSILWLNPNRGRWESIVCSFSSCHPRFWHRVSKTLESSVMRVIKVSLVMLMTAFGSNRKMKAGCQWNQSRHQKVETFSPTSPPIHSRRGEGLKIEFSHQELMI